MSSVPTIRLVVLDIDGVITDGTVMLLGSGDEVRSIHFHDLDAVARLRRLGVAVAIVSGESGASSRLVAERFGVEDAIWGAKDKLGALEQITARHGVALDETCYVGDADRDAPALQAVGVGVAPSDATAVARAAADRVLDTPGGHGAVAATVALLDESGALPEATDAS